MNIQQLLETMAARIAESASVKSVYGEPVVAGDRTVIPVARVRYAFGGGGGQGPERDREASGGGGGAHVSVRPCGVVEVGPEGVRFIEFEDRRRLRAALALGFVLGAAAVEWASRPARRKLLS